MAYERLFPLSRGSNNLIWLTGNPKFKRIWKSRGKLIFIHSLFIINKRRIKKIIGIYKITEKENPKNFYIGKSNDIQRRFKEHMQKSYSQSRIPFDGYIKEKGIDAFKYEVIEECELEVLNDREQYWIEKLEATKSGNKFEGGLTNVVGEHNPRAKLTEKDVRKIRKAYDNHLRQKDVYEEYKNIISFKYFQNLWQGRSWGHVMPEVFTEENKNYYIYQNSNSEQGYTSRFSNEEVIKIRKRYINESAKQIYSDYETRISYQGFQAILHGRTYRTLPIYKKQKKEWINI